VLDPALQFLDQRIGWRGMAGEDHVRFNDIAANGVWCGRNCAFDDCRVFQQGGFDVERSDAAAGRVEHRGGDGRGHADDDEFAQSLYAQRVKGVMLTHRNLVANVAQIRPLLAMGSDDSILAVLPFFHIYGMTVLLNAALHAQATLVVMQRFDLDEFLESIEKHRIVFGFIAPPIAVALTNNPLVDQYDLSSLRTLVSGTAPLDAELGTALAKRIGVQVIQGYGMSELSPVSHLMPADGGQERFGQIAPLNSCGWPVANTINKIVDPDSGHEVTVAGEGLSEPGELWVKGPNVMAGYLGNEEATNATIDSDGFLHTGDVAQVDHAGRVFIVDRLKELIKYKGYQVPPAELEAVLLTHAGILDSAVIGVTDDDGEEIPKAFVVRKPGADLTAEAVVDFVASRVAPHKKIRRVEFIDIISKSAAGKILRKELRS
jgi:acyl-CoA synthetase (AMP-forming)/AMP-acid ligase II